MFLCVCVCVSHLGGALEVHARHRQGGDVHGDTPVEVEGAHDEEEPAAYD